MKILSLILMTSLFNFAIAQEKIIGNKKIVTITKTVSKDFNSIASLGSFDITINDGTQDGNITIEGESNIIEHIQLEISQGILSFQLEKGNSYSYTKKISVELNSNQLKSLTITGSGNITTKGVQKTDEFSAKISGSGDINAKTNATTTNLAINGSGDLSIEGKTKNLDISVNGSGNINAFQLLSDNSNIRIAGSGNTRINSSNTLIATIMGSGNVRYKGNPKKIEKNIKGSGKISQD